ncbi:MAG: Lrp/AsnC family transcriptional regulator [Halioglobus sp.]
MSDLDRIDLEILNHLSNNARSTNKDLAKKLGVAPSTCFERVRVLQEKRILKGFHAEVDPTALGITLHAMVSIRLEAHSRKTVDSFYKHAVQLKEVTGVYYLSGANDFLVKVAVNDAEGLRNFVLDAFAERPEVAHIETSIIYQQTTKYGIPYDIEAFAED